MSRRSIIKLLASHSLVIAAAILLSRASHGEKAAPTRTAAESGQSYAASPSTIERPRGKWRSREYAQAWGAVRTAKLTKPDRIKLQRDLLQNWAQIDLHAAIEAALEESWIAEPQYRTRTIPGGPLLSAMNDAFAQDPEASWEMIQGGSFGFAAGMLRQVWIDAVAKDSPFYLAGKLEMFSPEDRRTALFACSNEAHHQRPGYEVYDQLLKVLIRYPENMVSAADISFLTGTYPASATPRLKELVLNTDPADSRMLRLHALNFGKQIAGKPVGEIKAELAVLPSSARGEVLFAALTADGRNFPTPQPDQTVALIGLLIEGDEWEKLARTEIARQVSSMASASSRKAADWAAGLPIRKETGKLFDEGVEPYIRNNLDTSPDWIGQIPPGEWRDRAYVQYSQAALGYYNDTAKSDWAMALISDPALKAEAESRRAQWEKLKKN